MIITIIILILILFIIYTYIHNIQEGFVWDNNTTCKYKKFVKYYSPTYRFNLDVMKKNATDDEIKYLLENGKYKWSEKTKELYKKSIEDNNLIQYNPEALLNQDMGIYPEYAIKQKLLWNTKEGKFLLYGAKLPDNKNQIPNTNNILKCELDSNDNKFYMNKKIYNGIDIMDNYYKCDTGKVSNNDIPLLLPGFQFLKNICNPCGPLNDSPDYSCPFRLKTKNNNKISSIWKQFWNL